MVEIELIFEVVNLLAFAAPVATAVAVLLDLVGVLVWVAVLGEVTRKTLAIWPGGRWRRSNGSSHVDGIVQIDKLC